LTGTRFSHVFHNFFRPGRPACTVIFSRVWLVSFSVNHKDAKNSKIIKLSLFTPFALRVLCSEYFLLLPFNLLRVVAFVAVYRGGFRGLLVALFLMTAAAQAHLHIKKTDRVSFHCIFLLFMTGAAGRGLFASLMMADNAVLFQIELVPAVLKKNRPEVSFKRDDLRACVDLSGSGKAAAAEKKAADNSAGQQLFKHISDY
jgi:hypothetical protein